MILPFISSHVISLYSFAQALLGRARTLITYLNLYLNIIF